jgi:hypothetical protein
VKTDHEAGEGCLRGVFELHFADVLLHQARPDLMDGQDAPDERPDGDDEEEDGGKGSARVLPRRVAKALPNGGGAVGPGRAG